jgi:hypothetical protein
MKLQFTKEVSSIDYCTHVRDMNLVDILCDDMEAEEILVDNFLNQFPYNVLGNAVAKIVSKLRLGGQITITEHDIDFLCHNLSVGKLNHQEFNEIVFSGGPASCLFSIETIVDLLKQAGLKITEKFIDDNNLCVVKAKR